MTELVNHFKVEKKFDCYLVKLTSKCSQFQKHFFKFQANTLYEKLIKTGFLNLQKKLSHIRDYNKKNM